MSEKNKKNRKREKKAGLTGKIFIGLILGAMTGVIFHYAVPAGFVRDTVFVDGIFYVAGQGFLRLMQMLVVPLVFCSLVCGSSAIGDTATLGKVGVKTLIFYLSTTAIAITLAIGVANVVNPGIGLDTSAIEATDVAIAESTSFADTLLNIIPKNPIGALANGDMLPIILFAIIIGIILAKLGSRTETVSNFFSQFNDVMMEMTSMVMYVAPVGVFCLIAKTFSGIGFGAFVPLLKYMLGVLLALALHCFVVYMGLLKIFSGLNPFKFLRKFFPVMAFAFSTATSNATIPLSVDTLEREVGVSRKISSFTIPLGATINMDGTAIMQGVAVVFAAQAYGIELGIAGYLTVIATATLASIGTAGVPGVGLITLSMVFTSVGLPVEAIALIMGIDRILDMTRTAVNITGDAVCTTIVAKQNGALNEKHWALNEKHWAS
ncbi:MAG: dicarboxylate/amino acid:cation symporter [Lachnospiraceae bacterium]|nr:dicarboxylate/amino acid:cation symporter [Lachnospiraceae bacterium]